jgi:hypothetical protein
MLTSRLIASGPSQLALENEQLQREKEELTRLLLEAEERLSVLQDSVVQLQEEYRAESVDLQEQLAGLGTAIHEEHLAKRTLEKENHKLAKAKQVG